MYCNCKQMQIVSANAEQQSLKVIWGSYFVADHKGLFMFIRGCHIYTLVLGII